MTRVEWTEGAVADIEAIRDFIARDSQSYAALVAAELVLAVGQLRSFPDSGRIVPELRRPDLRELIHGSYRIVYRVRSPERVEVLTVFHGARLLRLELPG